mmetsp:Transcript_25054/g.61987  ORF Transcript_25054/g.61987 Transcript_25054/m.61987 type:complete len:144 (-) Transcript_25054:102-533(-)
MMDDGAGGGGAAGGGAGRWLWAAGRGRTRTWSWSIGRAAHAFDHVYTHSLNDLNPIDAWLSVCLPSGSLGIHVMIHSPSYAVACRSTHAPHEHQPCLSLSLSHEDYSQSQSHTKTDKYASGPFTATCQSPCPLGTVVSPSQGL